MTRTSALEHATQVDASTLDHATVAVVSEAVTETNELSVRLPDGREILLPKELVKVLQTSAEELSAGRSIMILAAVSHLTPAEVARILGLSRPFIARLLDHGEIPSERLPNSKHRRVKLADVIAFQERRERRRAGSDRLAEIIESEDLPY